jgi:response regulator RpfG family c-di-GMP phosphodiesterase
MTQKTVLSIGQCRPDQAAITHYLTSQFGARVLTADLPSDAWQVLQNQTVHLVLINRKLDADYSDGMEILQQILADKATAMLPVMLVSNFAEWQQKAVAMGATHGFGKAELNRPETKQRLSAVLS